MGGFSDPEVDRLYNVAVTSFDEATRREAFLSLNRWMSGQAFYEPLYNPVEIVLARTRLSGPAGEYAGQMGLTWNIFEWAVAD